LFSDVGLCAMQHTVFYLQQCLLWFALCWDFALDPAAFVPGRSRRFSCSKADAKGADKNKKQSRSEQEA
jgi:hypothetical protein